MAAPRFEEPSIYETKVRKNTPKHFGLGNPLELQQVVVVSLEALIIADHDGDLAGTLNEPLKEPDIV